MSLQERKVIRLSRARASVPRGIPEPGGGFTAFISLWLKPLRRAEARTEVRLNEYTVWLGCTVGSFDQGTLRPTRQFWAAPGFEPDSVFVAGEVKEGDELSALSS